MPNKFDLDIESVRKLAKLLEETGLSEIEYAEGDRKIRCVGQRAQMVQVAGPVAAAAAVVAAAARTRGSETDLAAVSRILEAATRTSTFPAFFDLTASKANVVAAPAAAPLPRLVDDDVSRGGSANGGVSPPETGSGGRKKAVLTMDSLNESMAECFKLKAQVLMVSRLLALF